MKKPSMPRPGLLPFAIAITVLNILGHTWLGFEQPWIAPLISLATAYSSELAIELAINGWKGARFLGGFGAFARFLLPAHITGLAVAMLLYTNERIAVVAFASAFAIFSKVLFRVRVPGKGNTVHFMNPSNLGIAVTLLIFHEWVSVAQPYQFTEEIAGASDWILPLIIICSGTFLNWRATKRIPLIAAWLAGFVLQAVIRSFLSDQSLAFLLAPMTGVAFILFTFYMITDPMTSPHAPKAQVIFGASSALAYGFLTFSGVVFGLFFSLCLVCAIRGGLMCVESRRRVPAKTEKFELEPLGAK